MTACAPVRRRWAACGGWVGVAFACWAAFAACGTEAPRDYGDPTALDQGTVALGLWLRVVSPSPTEVLSAPTVEVVVEAWPVDDGGARVDGAASLMVRVDGGAPRTADATDDGLHRVQVPLRPGANLLRIRAVDETTGRVREIDTVLQRQAGGSFVRLVGAAAEVGGGCPDDGADWPIAVSTDVLCVFGEASGAARLASGQGATVDVSPDADGRFVGRVGLAPDGTQVVRVTLDDAVDQRSILHDATPPALTVDTPVSPTRTGDARVLLDGTVDDAASGVDTLVIASDAGGTVYVAATPAWQAEVPLRIGTQTLAVTATDAAGNAASVTIDVVREREMVLRPPTPAGGAADLRLDRVALGALYDEDAQRDLVLAELDLEPTLVSVLGALSDPVGSGIDTSTWGTPEWTLWRLLTMTPDTADLEGTSFESMLTVATAIGLPPPRLLGDLFDREVDDRFLDNEFVAAAILDGLVATHPAARRSANGDIVVPVTLYDALNDLTPLGDRLGPDGDHPGITAGPVAAEVFEPGFAMSLRAQTNLTELQGVDLSRQSKAYLYRLDGDEVLAFDFEDPDAFAVVGLVDTPTVSLTFAMQEHDGFITAGTNREAGSDAERPGFFRGNSAAWDVAPWTLEHVIVDAGYRAFADIAADAGYERELVYAAGSIDEAATVTWSRGWLTVNTSADIGSPPTPRYAWDVLVEAAQVRMHDELAEGDADVRFELDRIPIGLTSDELIDAMRPTLQSQRDALSRELLGASGLAESGADFFYAPGTGGQVVLCSRAPGDDGGDWRWDNPGFFADAGLTTLISSTGPVAGLDDTNHHKLIVTAGDIAFVADDLGDVYRVEVVRASADEVALRATPVEGTP